MSILNDPIVTTKWIKPVMMFWAGICIQQGDTTPKLQACFIVEEGETVGLKNK